MHKIECAPNAIVYTTNKTTVALCTQVHCNHNTILSLLTYRFQTVYKTQHTKYYIICLYILERSHSFNPDLPWKANGTHAGGLVDRPQILKAILVTRHTAKKRLVRGMVGGGGGI